MTRLLPDPSLFPFDLEIERTLTHIRQAWRQLAFVNSESGSLEEHTNSLSLSTRDHHSSNNEETLYSSVGSAEISLSESGDSIMAEPPHRIILREAGAPDINLKPIQIWYPDLDPNFELKTGMINLLTKYNGLPGEDPLKHLKDFQVVCFTARRHGSDEVAVMVFTFSFSLEGKAKEWFYTQPEDVIFNWDLMRKEFLEKFYPPQKTDRMRKEISCIMQRDGETLYDYFCQGMNPQDKLLLDASSGGSLTKNKTAEEAWKVIADLAESTQYSRERNPQPKAISEVSPSGDAILTKTLGEMTILLRQITQGQQILQALLSPPPQPPRIEGPPRSCGICACNGHYTDECPQLQEDTTLSGSINAITLRSGTKLDEIGVVPTNLSEETQNEEIEDDVEVMKDEEKNIARGEEEPLKVKELKRKNPLEEPMPIPFPTLAKKANKQEELDPNMVKIFKNVEVTVPLFQAIQQVPKYAKFLKEVFTHKDKIGKLNKRPVDDSISSLISKKYNDPGPYLVTCVMGGMKFMDYFHILETPPIDSDKPSSILLGWPFLKTSRFKLDAYSGVYSFESDGKVVKFTLEESKKPVREAYSIFGCDIIEDQVIKVSKEQEEENVAKKSSSMDHTQSKIAKELEIFLLGEVSN
ncbi:uncharacterized protein [Arachis hypogaea]|uniref:uncharacterized protein n=1 Tax=Arachis hypogaea TaxID=3818 RepID=UPI003B21F5FA